MNDAGLPLPEGDDNVAVLRPCWFCKSSAVGIALGSVQVECENCGAMGPLAYTVRGAASMWNERMYRYDGDD